MVGVEFDAQLDLCRSQVSDTRDVSVGRSVAVYETHTHTEVSLAFVSRGVLRTVKPCWYWYL